MTLLCKAQAVFFDFLQNVKLPIFTRHLNSSYMFQLTLQRCQARSLNTLCQGSRVFTRTSWKIQTMCFGRSMIFQVIPAISEKDAGIQQSKNFCVVALNKLMMNLWTSSVYLCKTPKFLQHNQEESVHLTQNVVTIQLKYTNNKSEIKLFCHISWVCAYVFAYI